MLIVAVVTTVAVAAVTVSIYRTIVEEKRDDLEDLAAAEARLITLIAGLEASSTTNAASAPILDRIRDTLLESTGFGRTGEITVGRYDGDFIDFVGSNRSAGPIAPTRRSSSDGEPMRRALDGQSGSVIGRDFRGVEVLAAYRWVPELGVGVVAKMDVAELRATVWHGVSLGAIFGAVLVVCGALLIFILGENLRRELVVERERYYALFEGSRDGQCVLDGGRFEELNDRACELAGYERAEIIGKTLADFSPPTQADGRSSESVARERILAALDGKPQRDDWQFVRGDGELMDAAITLTPIDLGHKRRLLLTIQDVTQRRRAAEQRQRLQTVLEQTIDAVGMADGEGRITYMNAAARHLVGLGQAEDVTGRLITEFTDSKDSEAPIATAARHGSWTDEVMLRRIDGSTVPVSQAIVAHHDATGAIVYYSTIIRDLSGRKAAEHQTERLATAIGQINEGIVITDAEGKIEYVNDALTHITGYSARELLGQNPRVLKSGHHEEAFYEGLWKTIGRGEVWQERVVNRRKDGTFYQEEMTITPVRGDDGSIQSYVAAKRDITEQVLLESQLQQAQKMEAVGQLAGGVAHDFNNMLTGITGYAQLLLRDVDSDGKRADLKQILDLSHRAADLTQQLLAFSRRQQLEQVSVNLNALVGSTMKMLARLIPENIETEFKGAEDLAAVMADSGQMVQVLMNLAVNSRDSMREGGTLVIETTNTELDAAYASEHMGVEPGRYVVLSVTDTGIGMDEDTRQHIFEPFFTTKEAGEGTGLGLATVYGIVKQHGGHLNVYSEPGVGTAFKVYLPATDVEVAAARQTDDFRPGFSEASTVLLVEDEAAVREIVERTLGQLGCHVLSAGRPSEARILFDSSEGGIDLLLTDIVMPGGLGTELYNELREIDPELKVLFMSGYPDRGAVQLAGLPDSAMFLRKPFSPSTLAERVRHILGVS